MATVGADRCLLDGSLRLTVLAPDRLEARNLGSGLVSTMCRALHRLYRSAHVRRRKLTLERVVIACDRWKMFPGTAE